MTRPIAPWSPCPVPAIVTVNTVPADTGSGEKALVAPSGSAEGSAEGSGAVVSAITVTLESPAVPEKACWPSLTLVPTITPYLKDSTDTTVKVTSLLLSGSTLPLTTPLGSPLTLVADPSS
jgi:hypothetical protein